MAVVRLIARPMLSSMFIAGGVNALKNTDQMAERAKPVLDRIRPSVDRATSSLPVDVSDKMLVRANALLNIAAGLTLATGRAPRLSSLALIGSLVPTTLGGHRYWEESDPQQLAAQRVHFFKNVSMAGGLLLASVDTEGKPSLAWQARRQAKQATKEAKKQASKLTG